MTILRPSDYEWKSRPKCSIIVNDPITTYHHLVKEMANFDKKRWRRMVGILTKAEEFSR